MGHAVRLSGSTLQKLETQGTKDSRAGEWFLFLLTFHCRQVPSSVLQTPRRPPAQSRGTGQGMFQTPSSPYPLSHLPIYPCWQCLILSFRPESFQGAGGESVETLGNLEGTPGVNDRELGHRHRREENALITIHFWKWMFPSVAESLPFSVSIQLPKM